MKASVLPVFLLLITIAGCAAHIETPTAASVPSQNTYPLHIGNQWVYSTYNYSGFSPDELMWTTNVYTDTVTNVQQTDADTILVSFQHEMSAELLLDGPPENQRDHALAPASTSEYSLVLSGGKIFSRNAMWDGSETVGRGELVLEFPLQVGAKWFLNAEAVRLNPNEQPGEPWEVAKQEAIKTPAGNFENCFVLEQWVGGTTFDKWFCPKVGIVALQADHNGTPSGSKSLLIRYSLN